jgi:hypothetical protein
MDLSDLFVQLDVNTLRRDFERHREYIDRTIWDLQKVKELAAENLELKLRLSLLVQTLIAKGVFTAEDYAGLVAKAHAVHIKAET